MLGSLFNKVAGLLCIPAENIRKSLVPVNTAKFLRTTILEICGAAAYVTPIWENLKWQPSVFHSVKGKMLHLIQFSIFLKENKNSKQQEILCSWKHSN